MKEIVKTDDGDYTEVEYDEKNRVIEVNTPVDKDGNWCEGRETEWSTYQYRYVGDTHEPLCERNRGWTEGCFWTDWRYFYEEDEDEDEEEEQQKIIKKFYYRLSVKKFLFYVTVTIDGDIQKIHYKSPQVPKTHITHDYELENFWSFFWSLDDQIYAIRYLLNEVKSPLAFKSDDAMKKMCELICTGYQEI